jgi:ankyrin repeat protein
MSGQHEKKVEVPPQENKENATKADIKSAPQDLTGSPPLAFSQSDQTAVSLSLLPPELFSYIFGFLNPADLAGNLSLVSKSFLAQANTAEVNPATDTDQVLSFAPGRNAQLNELLINHTNQPLTELQYILLQPGHQSTRTQRRLFLQARGEILAGRLSLAEAMRQINELSDLSGGAFLTSELLLAKRLRAQLEPWQGDALRAGFTFADLCSNWLSREDVQQVQIGQQTAEELRALRTLRAYQRIGLEAGFTLEQVTSVWFTPIHAEATQPPYNLALHVLANTTPITPQQVLRRLLDIDDEIEMIPAAWRALMIAPFGEGPAQGYTHFYRAASWGRAAVLTAMHEAGGFNLQQWQTLITTPLADGPRTGYTPLYIAAVQGHAAVLTAMHEAGGFNQEQWRTLITTPLAHGDSAEITPLYIAAEKGHAAVLTAMHEAGGFNQEQWRTLITTPLAHGPHAEGMPLYIAAMRGRAAALTAMHKAGGFNQEQWRTLITTPLAHGSHAGYTPLYIAAMRGHAAVLTAMREAGGFNQEQWRTLITTPLAHGPRAGNTPLYIAAMRGHAAVLTAMRDAGRFNQQQWRTLINKPLAHGPSAGYTPLYIAAMQGDAAVLTAMREAGGYKPEDWQEMLTLMYKAGSSTVEWQTLITTPLADGPRAWRTPLYNAALQGHAAVLALMQVGGSYKQEEWQKLITKPVADGRSPDTGYTPLYVAAMQGHAAVLTTMCEAGGFNQEQWRTLITTPLARGTSDGRTPLYIAAVLGHAAALTAMREAGGFNQEQWRILITTPLAHGPRAGYTPLYIAAEKGHTAVLTAMREAGGYTQQQWQTLITTLSSYGFAGEVGTKENKDTMRRHDDGRLETKSINDQAEPSQPNVENLISGFISAQIDQLRTFGPQNEKFSSLLRSPLSPVKQIDNKHFLYGSYKEKFKERGANLKYLDDISYFLDTPDGRSTCETYFKILLDFQKCKDLIQLNMMKKSIAHYAEGHSGGEQTTLFRHFLKSTCLPRLTEFLQQAETQLQSMARLHSVPAGNSSVPGVTSSNSGKSETKSNVENKQSQPPVESLDESDWDMITVADVKDMTNSLAEAPKKEVKPGMAQQHGSGKRETKPAQSSQSSIFNSIAAIFGKKTPASSGPSTPAPQARTKAEGHEPPAPKGSSSSGSPEVQKKDNDPPDDNDSLIMMK